MIEYINIIGVISGGVLGLLFSYLSSKRRKQYSYDMIKGNHLARLQYDQAMANFVKGVDYLKADTSSIEERKSNIRRALQNLRKASIILPESEMVQYNLAVALLESAEHESEIDEADSLKEAIDKFSESYKLDSSSTRALEGLGVSLCRLSEYLQGDKVTETLEIGKEKLRKAVQLNSNSFSANLNYATALMQSYETSQLQDTGVIRESLKYFNKATRIAPKSSFCLERNALAYEELADTLNKDFAKSALRSSFDLHLTNVQENMEVPISYEGIRSVLFKLWAISPEREEILGTLRRVKQVFSSVKELVHSTEWSFLTSWGAILSEGSKYFRDENSKEMLKDALELFSGAAECKDNSVIFEYWGITLSRYAVHFPKEEAILKYRQALLMYEKANTIQENVHTVISNWATTLSNLSELLPDYEADKLIMKAMELFKLADKIEHNESINLDNWGIALARFAKRAEKSQAILLYKEACNKFEKSAKQDLKSYSVRFNWGSALSRLARLCETEEAAVCIRKAISLFEESDRIFPSNTLTLSYWADCLRIQAEFEDNVVQEELLRNAISKYKQAIQLTKEDIPTVIGLAVSQQLLADLCDTEEMEILLQDARSKFRLAEELGMDTYTLYYNWGIASFTCSEFESDIQQGSLLQEASELLVKALLHKPDDHNSLILLSSVLIRLTYLVSPSEKVKLLKRARALASKANEIKSECASYNLACIEALECNTGLAFKLISQLILNGTELCRIQNEKDFDSLHSDPRWENLLNCTTP